MRRHKNLEEKLDMIINKAIRKLGKEVTLSDSSISLLKYFGKNLIYLYDTEVEKNDHVKEKYTSEVMKNLGINMGEKTKEENEI